MTCTAARMTNRMIMIKGERNREERRRQKCDTSTRMSRGARLNETRAITTTTQVRTTMVTKVWEGKRGMRTCEKWKLSSRRRESLRESSFDETSALEKGKVNSIASDDDEGKGTGTLVAIGAVLLVVLAGSVYFREPISEALVGCSEYIDSLGAVKGPLLFAAVYFVLELVGVPAFPLTMSSGAIFGPLEGTMIVVSSATFAAVAAFLISRYGARDTFKKIATEKFGEQFRKIDRAIGNDGFGVIFMMRLSPLLPFSASNYLYGLTSVKLIQYMPASFLGMIPGTFMYVASGDVARTISAGNSATIEQIGPALFGLGLTALSASYVTKLAKEALTSDDDDDIDTRATRLEQENVVLDKEK